MANEEQLAILRRGVDAWNAWRLENQNVEVNLERAHLRWTHLEGVDLRGAHLEGANLEGAHLKRTDLRGAHLERANLEGAHLEKADLRVAHLDEADLRVAHLEGADFSWAHLKGANLRRARLEGANLSEAHMERANLEFAHLEGVDLRAAHLEGANLGAACLEGANLGGARLEGVDLRLAHLEGANLDATHLEEADLRGCRGLCLDETHIRNARFDARARDPWSQLRRKYTGPMMIFTLLFLTAFLVPYVVRTLGWIAINRVEVQLESKLNHLDEVAASSVPKNSVSAIALQVFSQKAHAKLMPEGRLHTSVWRLLIGVDRGWTFWFTASLLILFNILRALLTYLVGPMRDAEERSGISPVYLIPKGFKPLWREPSRIFEAYGWLIRLHWVVSWLWYFAVGSFLFHVWHWMRLPVWIYG